MTHVTAGKKMVITVIISRGESGIFFAKSAEAPTFLASHTDEHMLRAALPYMVKQWAEENGCSGVTIRVLPRRAAQATANRKVRMAVDYMAA